MFTCSPNPLAGVKMEGVRATEGGGKRQEGMGTVGRGDGERGKVREGDEGGK